MLIDEYDYFVKNILLPATMELVPCGVEHTQPRKLNVSSIFKAELMFSKFFITGVLPIELSQITSGFDIQANASFDHSLSGLCGLTQDDVKYAFAFLPPRKAAENEALPPDESTIDKDIDNLANRVGGYHFYDDTTVKPVFNTATCMEYLQGRFSNPHYQLQDPDHSEVNNTFLKRCAPSPVTLARNKLSQALEQECDGSYRSLEYEKLEQLFKLTSSVSSFHFGVYFVTLTSPDF